MDDLRMSLRHIAVKRGESTLAILGTAIAVAVLSSTVSLIGSYDAAFERYARQPQARQVSVEGNRGVRGEGGAAVRLDASAQQEISLSLADAATALAENEQLSVAYLERFVRFTTANVARFGLGGGPGGGPGGGAVVVDTAAAATAATAEAAAAAETADVPLLDEVQGYMISASYFDAYELKAARGYLFDDRDVSAGNAVAVVGSALAGKIFADGEALGKRIRLNGTVYSIGAVLEPYAYGSEGLSASFDELVFVPTRTATRGGPGGGFFGGANSLNFAVKAGGDASAAARGLEATFSRLYGAESVIVRTQISRQKREIERRQRILALLATLAAAVGVAAAVNVFNLMTGRVSRRARSIAIQRSLGAASVRVFRQTLLESGLLAAAGAALGSAFSPLIARFLGSILEASEQNAIELSLRWDLVALTAALSVLAAFLFAAPPAANAAGTVIVDALRDE